MGTTSDLLSAGAWETLVDPKKAPTKSAHSTLPYLHCCTTKHVYARHTFAFCFRLFSISPRSVLLPYNAKLLRHRPLLYRNGLLYRITQFTTAGRGKRNNKPRM